MADNCVYTDVGTGLQYVGSAEIRANFVENGLNVWTDTHVEHTHILISGDSFADEWTLTGVHTGDLPGLPATGRAFRLMGASVGQVRDGKFTKVTEYWNFADFLRQVGVLPVTIQGGT
jgi:steroid delta-isomerase-like uncharacterized protein